MKTFRMTAHICTFRGHFEWTANLIVCMFYGNILKMPVWVLATLWLCKFEFNFQVKLLCFYWKPRHSVLNCFDKKTLLFLHSWETTKINYFYILIFSLMSVTFCFVNIILLTDNAFIFVNKTSLLLELW